MKIMDCKMWCAVLMAFFVSSTSVGQTSFTSSQSGDWEDGNTWGNSSPGVQGTDYPDNNGDDNITIASGHTVTLQNNSTIDDFTIDSGGIFDYDGNTLSAGGTVTPFISDQTGDWGTNGTWLNGSSPGNGDRAIIVKGHTVTANNDQISDLTIDAGAVFDTDNNKDFTVTSNLTVNGTFLLNKTGDDLRLSTGPITLSGSGTIDASAGGEAININANTTLASGSDLTLFNDVVIANGITFTVEGAMIVTSGSITGGNASSQVTMGSTGSIEVDGALLSTGVLDAGTNSGNTIEYNGSAAQTVKNPSSSTYSNLIFSGTGTKTFPSSAITVDSDLTVTAGTLDINSQNITIGGNWTNSSTISNLSTVTFNGTSDQSITTNATNFVNVTINKSSGTLNLNENVTVTGTLIMTLGNIDTGSNTFTLGSGSEGTLTYTAGRIIGTFGHYIGSSTTSQFTYPIGTVSSDRTALVTFDETGGGRQAGVVYVQFIETDPGTSGLPVTDDITIYNAFNEGYWDFTVDGFSKGNSNSFDLSLTGDGFSSFTIGANTRILQRDDTGTNWAADGTHGSVSTNTITRDNIDTFVSQFTFGDDTNCTGPSDPSISGVTDVCTSDTNDTYSVTLNSGNDYQWTVVGGTIDGQSNPTGFITNLNSISVDWSSTGQVGTVTVQERNTCTTSNEISIEVNVNSIAPSSITGNTLVAENSTAIAYAVTSSANTTYTWSITGGTQATGGTTNSITVDWGDNGAGTVGVTATKTSPSCAASSETQLSVTKYIVVDSNAGAGACNGNWNDGDCWATGTVPLSSESARIVSGESLNMASNESISNLIINGTLTVNSPRSIDVGGDLTLNSGGTLTGTGTVTMSGSLSSPQNQIDGTGSISGTFTIDITTASKTIASTAVITQTSGTTNLSIASGLTVTNEGSIEIAGNITGAAASSTWTNSTNSTLIIGGALLATGTLNSVASGNTVVYNSATAANIKVPSSSYQNLEIQDGTKSLTATIDVNDDFILTSGTFAMAANNMTVADAFTYTAGTLTSTGTITLDGSANQTMSGTWTIPNLTINNTLDGSDAITISDNITISTTLTLTDGIVGTGANNVSISNTATGGIAGGSAASFVNGILARQTNSTGLYDFPVGASTTYKRVGITPTATGGSTYQVQGFQTAFSDLTNLGTGLNNVSGVEYWDIQRTAGTDPAQIRLYWVTQSASGISQAIDLRVAHYTGGQWEDRGNGSNSGDVDPGFIESSTATSTFSPFTLGSATGSENPLPVVLIEFNGHYDNISGQIKLEWATASEINNEKFIIEESIDGKYFEAIGEVTGHGNSSEIHRYSFFHTTRHSKPFYRLKQIDYDGAFEYSNTIQIRVVDLSASVTIFPNPIKTGQSVTVAFSFSSTEGYMKLSNLSGEEIRLWDLNSNYHQLNIPNLQNGIYLLSIVTPDGMATKKLIVQ